MPSASSVPLLPHPSDPLTASEISTAAEFARSLFSSPLRFNTITLVEPSVKPETPRRLASVLLLDESTFTHHELHIAVPAPKLHFRRHLPASAQPPLTPDDCILAEQISKSDLRVGTHARAHGVTDLVDGLACDPWSVHFVGGEKLMWGSGRFVQLFLYRREGKEDNYYARPLPGVAIVDLFKRKVVAFEEEERTVGTSENGVNYVRKWMKGNQYLPRDVSNMHMKPLNVVQEQGVSFTVRGRQVEWGAWKLRIGFTAREGVILRDVEYAGRSVLKRAALVEMAVPYGDPRMPYVRKCAFDVGDYGLGFCANSLRLGCDCLGNIFYFDETLNDSLGNPYTIEKAVCLHEEDAGILYKHMEYRTGHAESKRARKLVISFIATVVNYEYLFYWYVHSDGSIGLDIKLSGELSTNVPSRGETTPTHGTFVAPGVNAQIHQHMFCARLDMAVDGAENTVSEINFVTEPPGPDNPFSNAFHAEETLLRTEKEARRDYTPGRTWKISNSNHLNSVNGRPVAYRLMPYTSGSAGPALLCGEGSVVGKRGKFARKSLWVTKYEEGERFPAGEFPVQSSGSEEGGVWEWGEQNRGIENEKIVLWHCFGVAHLPRVEDFPIMNCEMVGFKMAQDGFLMGNGGIGIATEEAESGSVCCN